MIHLCVCVCVFDMLLTCLSSHLASCLVPEFKLILLTVLYLLISFLFFACLLLGPKLWRFCLNNDRVLNCLSACCVLYCYSVLLIWCSCIWQQDILKHWVLCNEAVPVSWSHLPPAPIFFTGFRVSRLCHRWWKYPGCWQGSRGIPSSWRIFGYSNLLWFPLISMDFYWFLWLNTLGKKRGATWGNISQLDLQLASTSLVKVSESLKHDLPARQWIMSTMPFVFAQAGLSGLAQHSLQMVKHLTPRNACLVQVIFRMYFDGFPEDRNMVLSHSNNFINNIMLVIHFEMMLG